MFALPPFIFSFTPSFVSMTYPSLLLCPSPLPEGKDYPNYPLFLYNLRTLELTLKYLPHQALACPQMAVLSNVSVSNSESRWMKHFIGTNFKKCLRFASLLYVDNERWLSWGSTKVRASSSSKWRCVIQNKVDFCSSRSDTAEAES